MEEERARQAAATAAAQAAGGEAGGEGAVAAGEAATGVGQQHRKLDALEQGYRLPAAGAVVSMGFVGRVEYAAPVCFSCASKLSTPGRAWLRRRCRRRGRGGGHGD